ncbi:MAG: NTPase [Anaerolineales bacterium]|jgi:nucleoside-triphosphatase
MSRVILLTGRPGCGKTTTIRRVLEKYPGDAGGFYTQEIREGGVRKGFEIVTLDGERGILAHVDIPGKQRVGKYRLDLEAFERLAIPAIQGAVERGALVVIDEIGPMEIQSKRFRGVVMQAIESEAKVLGTIVMRSIPFTDGIKNMEGVEVMEVTPENRNEMQRRIADMLMGE